MSDYTREKVLRIPINEEDKKCIFEKYNIEDIWDLEYTLDIFDSATPNKFQIAPTEKEFIDYVLEYDPYTHFGDFGKVRKLLESEKTKYEPIFHKLWEGFDINKVRLVEFCWYNCSEAPDYYDIEIDEFYKEV